MKDNGLMALPPYKPLQTELWKVKFQCHPRWWWLKGLVPRPLVQACPSSWKNLPQKSHGTRAPDLWLRNSSLWNMEVGPWRYPILSNTFGNLENQIQIMNQNVTDFQMAKNKSIWSPISLSQYLKRDLGKNVGYENLPSCRIPVLSTEFCHVLVELGYSTLMLSNGRINILLRVNLPQMARPNISTRSHQIPTFSSPHF